MSDAAQGGDTLDHHLSALEEDYCLNVMNMKAREAKRMDSAGCTSDNTDDVEDDLEINIYREFATRCLHGMLKNRSLLRRDVQANAYGAYIAYRRERIKWMKRNGGIRSRVFRRMIQSSSAWTDRDQEVVKNSTP